MQESQRWSPHGRYGDATLRRHSRASHEIITRKRSVDEAREHYADQASAYVLGREAPYAEKLLFEVARGGTADLDESIIAEPMARQMAEKTKELIGT